MALLIWIVRALVIMLILRIALRLLMPTQMRGGAGRRADPEKLERVGGALVRDPHCGTYVPQARALKVGLGANVQYFCSAACRDAFVAAHNSVAS
jgi:uncharacterized protein